jgi:hypothetical protein
MSMDRITATRYLAWAKSGARPWRVCCARDHAAVPTDLYTARYFAARWLAVDGVSETIVLPDAVDPNRYRPAHIPFVAWRASVTRDTSPTTVRDLLHDPAYVTDLTDLTSTPTTR